MAKYKNRRKSHLDDDEDYDFAADVRKGRHEDQDDNIKQVEKDEEQAEQAKLAYTGPSLARFKSGIRQSLTWAEKKAKYRKKMRAAPTGTPEHDKWQAYTKANRESSRTNRHEMKQAMAKLEDEKVKGVKRQKKRADKANAEKQKVERSLARQTKESSVLVEKLKKQLAEQAILITRLSVIAKNAIQSCYATQQYYWRLEAQLDEAEVPRKYIGPVLGRETLSESAQQAID